MASGGAGEVLLKIGAMLVVAGASLLGALPPLWQKPRSQQAAGKAPSEAERCLSDASYLLRAFTVSRCHPPDPCPCLAVRLRPSVLNAAAA